MNAEHRILDLLEQGHKMDKHQAAALAYCGTAYAARVLNMARVLKLCRIYDWELNISQRIPVYIKYDGHPDAAKPKRKTAAVKSRLRRKNPVLREKERLRRDKLRREKKAAKDGGFNIPSMVQMLTIK